MKKLGIMICSGLFFAQLAQASDEFTLVSDFDAAACSQIRSIISNPDNIAEGTVIINPQVHDLRYEDGACVITRTSENSCMTLAQTLGLDYHTMTSEDWANMHPECSGGSSDTYTVQDTLIFTAIYRHKVIGHYALMFSSDSKTTNLISIHYSLLTEAGFEFSNTAVDVIDLQTYKGRELILYRLLSQEPDPAQIMLELITSVESLPMNKGVQNALLVQLRFAQDKLEGDQGSTIFTHLNTFTHLVLAQSDKHLPEDAAAALIGKAELLVTLLSAY